MRPVVLLHGFLGFSRLWGIQYFKGVPDLIQRRHPRAAVFHPAVDPDGTIEGRALRLDRALRERFGNRERVHLIAHSMGGLDARYLISRRGLDRAKAVRSLTTLGTPHWGTPAAERLVDFFSHPGRRPYRTWLERLHRDLKDGSVVDYLLDVLAPLDGGLPQMTPSAMVRFNRRHPNAPGVSYASYAGVVTRRERLSPFLRAFHEVVRAAPPPAGGPNDGLVSLESARGEGLGRNGFRFVRALPADHFNLIGHDWDPGARLVRWLAGKGPRRLLSVYNDILGRIERL